MKPVELNLHNHTFNLRMDMTAIGDIQELTGVDLLNGGKQAQEELRKPRVITATLYALAGGEETQMTLREFGRLLDVQHLEHAMKQLQEVFTRDASPAEEPAEGKVKGKPAG